MISLWLCKDVIDEDDCTLRSVKPELHEVHGFAGDGDFMSIEGNPFGLTVGQCIPVKLIKVEESG